MPTTTLPSGERVPAFGLGTWRMGESAAVRRTEVAAVRLGIELGLNLIDTAEMYGEGNAEEIVGEAIRGKRDGLFIVSKVLPSNASKAGTIAACERSLRRLGIDCLDLYLLHWPGPHPLAATVKSFTALQRSGKIRHWGVSNFDTADMTDLVRLAGGDACATNQVLYNLARRGIEHDLVPWCRRRHMPIMAYSPVDQGRLLGHRALLAVARKLAATPAQVALAWLLRQEGMIVIPKATEPDHIRDNLAAATLRIPDEQLRALAQAFPPPTRAVALEML
ncbi:MAG: aldo/keto reductase [Alphaproteobacteria bacterium]|nr:aldo/keto reductase [Alphaproteobacteria bacterium]